MYEKLVNYAAKQLELDVSEITPDSTFESLGIDSLDIVELLMNVEEEFGVSIEPDPSIATVGDLIAKIEELKNN